MNINKYQSLIGNWIKTFVLLGTLSYLLVILGRALGGEHGAIMAFVFALIFNLIAYFFSASIALKMYGARPLDPDRYKDLYDDVAELSYDANIPTPKIWIIESEACNAFATGRNPQNGSIAFTTTILKVLDRDEIRGVAAHELSHIKNRDILVGTIAATIAAAIGYLADIMRWRVFWGGSSRKANSKGVGYFGILILSIFVPLITFLIQLAISRTREYLADETGSHLSKDPLALAKGLLKIEAYNNGYFKTSEGATESSYADRAFSALFIAKNKPNRWNFFKSIFSTHPSVEDRVAKLEKLNQTILKR